MQFFLDSRRYLIVGQVANAAGMGMVQLLAMVEMEFLFVYLIAYLAVCLTERNALVHQLIDGLYAEEVFIFFILQDTILYLDIRQHQAHHLQTGFSFFDGGEKDLFSELQVAMIAGG